MQLGRSGQEWTKRVQMELVGKDLLAVLSSERSAITDSAHLNDHLHEILLRNDVLAVDDLLEDAGKYDLLVHVEVDAVQLAEPDKIGADQDAELAALDFALFAVS